MAKSSKSTQGKRESRRHSGRPTVADVAKLAKCSPMTVSRVVNNDTGVRESTRAAVQQAIDTLEYKPNQAARKLAGAKQTRIAMLYSNPSASYLSELLMGGLDEAAEHDAHLIVERCELDGSEGAVIRRLVDSGIDGFLLPSPLCEEDVMLELVDELDLKCVAVGTGTALQNQSTIKINDYQAAYDMTAHIIAQGHKDIGFIVGSQHQSVSSQRLQGYRDAMRDAGLEILDRNVAKGQFTYKSGLDAAGALLSQPEKPTAIFASNDDMAAATVSVAHRMGLDVPADLSVCGFDDTAIASTIWPELTTIRQPIARMARRAVELLLREIKQRDTRQTAGPKLVELDYEFVRRQSDAAPAAGANREAAE